MILGLLTLWGCGGSTAIEPDRTARPTSPRVTDVAPAARDPLDGLNERARAGATAETLHGVSVEDPYRSLETESPETERWINAQSAHTAEVLRPWRSERAAARISELVTIGTLNHGRSAGGLFFYSKREGDREQPCLYVVAKEAGRAGAANSAPRMLVDPSTYGERAALDWFYPSPNGKYVAFGISQNGDEKSTLHVLEVESGRVQAERIPRTKWCSLSWLHSEDGFYYTRYPKAGEPNFDAENEDTYFPRVFFHSLGRDPQADPLVFGATEGTYFPGPEVSDDDRYVVLNVDRGWSATDVYLLDRNDPTGTPRPVVEGMDHVTYARVAKGKLFLRTNLDAPKYRIVQAPLAAPAQQARWQTIIAEGDAPIEDWGITRSKIVVHFVEDVRSHIRLFDLRGQPRGEVTLPTRGSVDSIGANDSNDDVAMVFSSYLYPPALLAVNAASRTTTELDRVHTDFDFEAYELEQASVPSRDGTSINVYLLHKKGMVRDGENPVLAYAYGGFNISLLPVFTRHALYWLEQGGVFVVANLRGGSEFGEDWHRAGSLLNKKNVFDDFESVLRWLSSSRISRPEKIAITGGSNGGLLMGAMITRAPDAFAAAAAYVGLYDMVRYHRFPPAELWVTEYGSAENPDDFVNLLSYSPYHQVRQGTEYPSILIETADHDSRVFWGHSTKFAARLQEASASDRPVLFYMVRSVGHGAGTRASDLVERYVRAYTFIEHELGRAHRPNNAVASSVTEP